MREIFAKSEKDLNPVDYRHKTCSMGLQLFQGRMWSPPELNRYSSTLQTTSYNFSATATTPEMCAGVVKAPKLHEAHTLRI